MLLLFLAACRPAPPSCVPHRATPAFTRETVLPPDGQIPAAASIREIEKGTFAYADPIRKELRLLHAPSALAGAPIAADVGAPVRASAADFDGDGDLDLLVADIGILWPSDEPVGRVLLLERHGDDWKTHVLLDRVGRIACAEWGDLDGDGDLDAAVCEFGQVHGGLHWLEDRAGTWVDHRLAASPGWEDARPVDLDGDGDLDLATAVSQDEESVAVWRNDGHGAFTREDAFHAGEKWFGLAGVEPVDLDGDGDQDLLVPNGDTMDRDLPAGVDPDGYYGLAWLENDGTGHFARREVTRIWGAYAVKAADLDGDCDEDLVLATNQVSKRFPGSRRRALVWLENDGTQRFTPHEIDGGAAQAVTLAVSDVDGDGDLDVLGGTLYQDEDEGEARLVVLRNAGR